MKASLSDHGALFHSGSLLAFVSTLLLFSVCVTLLLALCAAHSPSLHVLNGRKGESSERSLAIAAPEEFKKQEFSFRLSSSASTAINKLGNSFRISSFRDSSASAAINKFGNSFRISSFRDSSASFRNSSFRISSFRMDSCKQVDGGMDSLRKIRPAGVEEEQESKEEPAVWQRAILRGERCSPLSFSGLVLYDEKGNQLPSFCEDTKEPNLHNNPPTMEDRVRKPRFGSTSGSELETGF